MTDEPAKCPSCGIHYEDHDGLIPTCRKFREFVAEIRAADRLPTVSMTAERVRSVLVAFDEEAK